MFKIGGNSLQTVDKYKYLGVMFHEFKDYKVNAERLSEAGGRALGSGIILKIHNPNNFWIKTFEKLVSSCVVQILDYNSSVWAFQDYAFVNLVQNKAIRFFLGVHKFAPRVATNGDVGWLPCKERHWYNIVRLWNKLIRMDDSRVCKQVFNWDPERCLNNWSWDVKLILSHIDLEDYFHKNRLVIFLL